MKLLLIHNNYGVYSGEEVVFDKQVALFREMGHEVVVYRKTTEGLRDTLWGDFKGLLCGFYAPDAVRDIKRMMKENKPSAVVIHNLYPYISPAILKHIKKSGVPIIMTVHNFRLMCPTGLFMRNNMPCELCLKAGNEWNCIRHNCEHSVIKSIGYAGRNWYARVTKAYKDNVDIYACITRFQIQKLTEAGFDSSKLKYIPNFLDHSPLSTLHSPLSTDYVAVSGRLSREKGIDLILQVAARMPDVQFRFAGTLRPEEKIIVPIPENCVLLGHLSKEKLSEFYQNSRFLLVGSRCYEGFPMTILEEATFSKPAIAPGHAGFLEIIDNNVTGLHFIPSDMNDMEQKIRQLWNNPEKCGEMGNNAFEKLKNNYLSDIVKNEWEKIFECV